MLVPSTLCGVVHNSSERPTPASQCVLNAFSLPWLDELAACQRGGMLMNSPHERVVGPTSGPHAGSASSNDSGNAPRSMEARSRTP